MNVAPVSSGSMPLPRPQVPDHVVQRGENIDSIAVQHHVTPVALMQANPQVRNPDVIYPGQHLAIPAPAATDTASNPTQATLGGKGDVSSQKTGDDKNGTTATAQGGVSMGSDGSASGSSQETRRTSASGTTTTRSSGVNGSLSADPDKGSVSLSGGTSFSHEVKNSRGVGVSFGVDTNATVTAGKKTADGVTTYSASTDASITLEGGASAKEASLTIGRTEGIKASFEVAMPDAPAKGRNLALINPFDANSMPTGTKITMDGSHYSGTEFEATFRHLALETNITNEKGVSTVIEKTGDHSVRVTAGPTRAIDAYNGLGVDFDVAKVMLGRSDSLSGSTLKSAQFDLSTAQGRAGYSDYLANGAVPTNNDIGISDVQKIEKVDFSSQTKLSGKVGPLDFSLDGAKNTGDSVVTTYADGTADSTVNLQYSGNVPMALTQKYDASGHEIPGARRYSYIIKTDENSAQLINAAQTGDIRKGKDGPVKPGQSVTLTYTEDQMRTLMTDAQNAVKGSSMGMNDLRTLTQDYDGKFVDSPRDFALGLARNLGGTDFGSAQRLFNISMWASAQNSRPQGFTALPGTVTVQS